MPIENIMTCLKFNGVAGGLALFLLLVAPVMVAAQQTFRMKDASAKVDVEINIGKCGGEDCLPPAKFVFYRKGTSRPFQIIAVAETDMWDAEPKANVTRRYDEQSLINFADFNFDGEEDVAVCDGKNGGYGGPSYQVYLYSPVQRRYVRNAAFTRLNQDGNLGFFEIDKKRQMLNRYTKSGCCWHQTEGYSVRNGRPVKTYEFTEDAMSVPDVVIVTTRRLVNGRWRTSTKRAKTAEYYK